MSASLVDRSVSDGIRVALRPTPRGVVGLVDDLLDIARGQVLRLTHTGGACRVEPTVGAPFEVPLPRSVFRAALARIAALCNEHRPDAVSPYGGSCELPGALRVSFTNTPEELRLDFDTAGSHAAPGLPAPTPAASVEPRPTRPLPP
jgi:hypothetical protein